MDNNAVPPPLPPRGSTRTSGPKPEAPTTSQPPDVSRTTKPPATCGNPDPAPNGTLPCNGEKHLPNGEQQRDHRHLAQGVRSMSSPAVTTPGSGATSLHAFGWYWGPAEKEVVKEAMAGMPDGAFMVRDASQTPGEYTLTVKKDGLNKLVRIYHEKGMYGFSKPCTYDSVAALILFYTAHSMSEYNHSMDVRLEKPVFKPSDTPVRTMPRSGRAQAKKSLSLDDQVSPRPGSGPTFKRAGTPEVVMADWYWGSITKAEVMERMADTADGSFLVRDSTNNPGEYTLTVKTGGMNRLVRIFNDGNRFGFSDPCEFDSVSSLVDYFKTHSLEEYNSTMRVRLLHPVRHSEADTELRDTNESLKQLQHINSMLNSLEKQFDKRSEDLELLKMNQDDLSREVKCKEAIIQVVDRQLGALAATMKQRVSSSKEVKDHVETTKMELEQMCERMHREFDAKVQECLESLSDVQHTLATVANMRLSKNEVEKEQRNLISSLVYHHGISQCDPRLQRQYVATPQAEATDRQAKLLERKAIPMLDTL
ncbi:phosphatidylinositol 3-kinase regulatory subunit beta-like [Sycon ciliatum]|uniref:phosphatidylinositol 3-kinase regulatory subunit beta-like n=1 Tax=Sycon ciliatum TaxID=27933 RepID=UPI0020AE6F75